MRYRIVGDTGSWIRNVPDPRIVRREGANHNAGTVFAAACAIRFAVPCLPTVQTRLRKQQVSLFNTTKNKSS